MKIYSYLPASDAYTTYRPDGGGEEQIMEHGMIDGRIYFSGPDDLPQQREDLQIEEAVLTDQLKEEIKRISPHFQLISQRIIDKIRAKYPIDEELYLARIGVGAATGMYQPAPEEMVEMQEFGVFVEDARTWGRAQRAALGV